MVPTNKYTVWTSNHEGEFICANEIIVFDGLVCFIKKDGLTRTTVATFSLKEFVRNNPDWKLLENTD